MLQHHLLEHEEPMFLERDFNCTLAPHLTVLSSQRQLNMIRWRSDDFYIRHIFSMFLKMTWSEQKKRGPYQTFMRRAHTYFYTLPGDGSAST